MENITKQISIKVIGEMSEAMAIAAVNSAVRSDQIPREEPLRDHKVIIGDDEIFMDAYPHGSGNAYIVWKHQK